MAGNWYRLKRPVTGADWTRGPKGAPVTLLEYIDFQCPCCQGSYPAIEHLLHDYEEQVHFAVRQFPVGSIHPFAEQAARAAEAAGRQGKLWEMYHLLIQARGRLGIEHLEGFARQLDLDADRFAADMDSDAVAEAVQEDKGTGLRSGVNGTPTLFINGVRYEGAVCPIQEEDLRAALEEARATAAA